MERAFEGASLQFRRTQNSWSCARTNGGPVIRQIQKKNAVNKEQNERKNQRGNKVTNKKHKSTAKTARTACVCLVGSRYT